MPRAWEFQMPTQVRFGRGGLRKLGDTAAEFGRAAMLVGYGDQAGLETVYGKAAKSLSAAGLSVVEFFEVPPDPDAEVGEQGARLAKESGAEVVVAVGGGSVIDAAKGVAAVARLGGCLWDYSNANPDARPVDDALPLVAVPTTAGTGSEVTGVAVFTHHGKGTMPEFPLKTSIFGPGVRPKVALIDPDLSVGCPPGLTAACGADALGHAIEACMSRRANPISSALAGKAVGLIVANLAQAVADPDAREPREPLALAAMLAGAAFSEAGVTMTHAIAQALGGLLHVPHGLGVALGTPLNLRYNAEQCTDVYCQLAHYCGIFADTPEQQAARFVDRVVELLREIGLPEKVDLPADAPDDLAGKLARNAIESTPVPIKLNPRKIDEPALKQLFEEIL